MFFDFTYSFTPIKGNTHQGKSTRREIDIMKKLKLKITICDDIITIKSGRETELFQGYTVEEAVKLFMERF